MLSREQVESLNRRWASIFDKTKLAYRLSINTPYTREAVQEMIDSIKVMAGFEKNSEEAEGTLVVELNAHKAITYAMEYATSLDIAVKHTFTIQFRNIWKQKS